MSVSSAVRRIGAAVSVRYGTDPRWFFRWRKRFYYAWMAMRHSDLCRAWFDFLDSAEIRPFVAANPALPLKPFKPYLSLRLDVGRRMQVIRDTLLFLVGHKGALQHIVGEHKPAVAAIDLGADTTISLCLMINCQKEGELTLLLRLADRRTAAISAFAFEHNPDESHVMRIARIQGVKDPELQRRLEKSMHGLRPKSLMLFASREVAHAFGVREISGVSNASQVYNKKVLIPVPGLHRLSFDYDAFWTEADGVPAADGWFRLPPRLSKRDPAAMKPNKRSMYKKRYAMLDDISGQIHRALGSPPTALP